MPPAETHIASFAVLAAPGCGPAAAAAIAGMPDCEVPLAEGGRLVVVVESTDPGRVGDLLTRIQLLDGVLAANLVFHHVEPLPPEQDQEQGLESEDIRP